MSLSPSTSEGFELVPLKTGLTSLRSLLNLETFHPVTGPAVEAQVLHVEQQRLVERAGQTVEPFIIWDVGLGAAANALAAIRALESVGAQVEVHSFDRSTAALDFALKHVDELQYLKEGEIALHKLLSDQEIEWSPGLKWRFHAGDFAQALKQSSAFLKVPPPHAILYDPYSPTKNAEMWTLEHFQRLFKRLDSSRPCLLTNYTRSTAVRITLLLAGFYVGIGSAVGEKAETTIASNCLDLIERPLGRSWIERRVRISHNAAPLREDLSGDMSQQPISSEDFERLIRLPQFD